jgi:LmbE family N-acetylglucosaminyl deacetylase
MHKKILVVAAHSDDEALGCSGTMARHVNEGAEVRIVFMTNGVGSRDSDPDKAVERESLSQQAAKHIGIKSLYVNDYPDNQMDTVPLLEIVQNLESVIGEYQPEVIYTHHSGDLNIDHRVTNQALMTACRPAPGGSVKEIYAFEVLSSSEWNSPRQHAFVPNVFVDISSYIDVKRKVLEIYSQEMRQPPHSRSIENAIRLNALRGNAIGVNYAEAFELLRYIR